MFRLFLNFQNVFSIVYFIIENKNKKHQNGHFLWGWFEFPNVGMQSTMIIIWFLICYFVLEFIINRMSLECEFVFG
jgi:hypothetical protein